MAEFCFGARAYIKPLLHAAKYPHCSVNGIFLAEKQKDGAKTPLQVRDSIPLFHSNLTLAPMMEVALWQIDAYCQRNDLVIAGYYQANEIISDLSPSGIACQLANKIKENFGDAFLLMIDNEHVIDDDAENPYILYCSVDSRWKKVERKIPVSREVAEAACPLIQSRAFRDLVDFDCHLNDITLNWQNPQINDQIEEFF